MTFTLSRAGSLRARSEKLEDRILLAGDFCASDTNSPHEMSAYVASADSMVDTSLRPSVEPELRALAAPGLSAANTVREQFQLDGAGQTVAIIDSGIAFDHDALGGGFGLGHRVVGGWDFTEPHDRSPYDDAPVGLHGTHVAGIIGSSDPKYPGIAPEVDFVALRVFDDRGYSRIDWLEAALQWVHDHQTSFDNPITAVNLSVRFDDSVDDDQLLRIEDELKALYDDNIFVAVAAGNDFSPDAAFEIGYPASSSWVVPVGSVNASNQISTFSQRNERILAAPGEVITSTAPDHVQNSNGRTDDFYTMTGTSMAAPYVAGASVLVREAMQMAGRAEVAQADIFDHLRATADMTHDRVTGIKYPVINIEQAISTLHEAASRRSNSTGNSRANDPDVLANALELGTVDYSKVELAGGEHNLRLTASQDGTLTVVAEGWRSELQIYDATDRRLIVDSNTGRIDVQVKRGDQLIVQTDLVANSTLRIANLVSLSSGLLDVRGTAANDEIKIDRDLLSVNSIPYEIDQSVHSISVDGASGRDTLEITTRGDAEIRIAGLRVTETGRTVSSGTFEEVVVNREGPTGGSATVIGTGADDIVGVSNDRTVLRGGRFRFSAEGFKNYTVDANGGRRDRIRFEGTRGRERVTGSLDRVEFASSSIQATAIGFDQITVESHAGNDLAEIMGTAGNETVYATPSIVRYGSGGQTIYLRGIEEVSIDGGGGTDVARVIGSELSDTFAFGRAGFEFETSTFQFGGRGFETVSVYGRGGDDTSQIGDTVESDRFDISPTSVYMESKSHYVSVQQFEFNTVETAQRNSDRVFIEDSVGDDVFLANDKFARMSGAGYQNVARGFSHVIATSRRGGDDRASLFDSSGDDQLFWNKKKVLMLGDSFRNEIIGFSQATVRANRGHDQALLEAGDQAMNGDANRLRLLSSRAAARETVFIGFDEIEATVDTKSDVQISNVDYLFSLLD